MTWTTNYVKKFIQFDAEKIPKVCNIATMTIYLKLQNSQNINIDLQKFFNNVDMNTNIQYIEYNGNIKALNSYKRKSKKKSNFQNSLSLYIKAQNNCIHINFFKNGTIHGTGVKNVEDFIESVILINSYIDCSELLFIDDVNISMININFALEYQLNKNIFKNILKEQNISYTINKTQNLSLYFYTSENKEILVTLHKNSLIISKCTSEKDIIESYHWISHLLDSEKKKIINITIQEVLDNCDILKKNYNGK
jgi:TATA-box binding protein (TBP) (component of TFIID and TFIIIB)